MSKLVEYDENLKEQALQLVSLGKQSTVTIAEELGIKPSTLYNWVSKMRKENKNSNNKAQSKPEPSSPQALAEENRELRRALKKAEMERDILKKATAYFANESV